MSQPTAATVTVVSFGYLHAQPPTAHLTLDLRHHFRDPHINPAMRRRTAAERAVRDVVMGTPGVLELTEATAAAVRAYQSGPNPGPVTIAVGCAGGRHRAPTVALALADLLHGQDVTVHHRDLHQPVINR